MVNITNAPTLANHAVNKSWVDTYAVCGASTGGCFLYNGTYNNDYVIYVTKDFLPPSDETWLFEFHAQWSAYGIGNTRPDAIYNIKASKSSSITANDVADVLLTSVDNRWTAYGQQCRAFLTVAVTASTFSNVAKKLKFHTDQYNAQGVNYNSYFIKVTKMKTSAYTALQSIL